MSRPAVSRRTAALVTALLAASTLLATPASAFVDPDGNPVVVDEGLRAEGASERPLEPSLSRSAAVAAAKAPKAKKRLRTLVVPLRWAGAGKDSSGKAFKQRARASMQQADTYFRTVSRGRIGHRTTVLGWQKIARPPARCGIVNQMGHLTQKGLAKARRAGKNPHRFDRIIFYVTAKACTDSAVAGIGSMPGRFVWLQGTLDPQVVIHELGHNLGLGHSSYRMCQNKKGSKRLILGKARRCTDLEYGDASDMMGNSSDAGWFSAPKLAQLGWFTKKNLATNTKARKRTYRLRPLSAATSKLKAVRVKGTKGRHYWVEYRRPTGLDARLAPGLTGVQIRMGAPRAWGGASSVLDMLPDPDQAWDDQYSVALGPRSSWTSPEGIRFQVGGTGARAKVTVRRGARKARKPLAPVLRATGSDLGADARWSRAKDRGTPVQSYVVRYRASDGTTTRSTVDQLRGQLLREALDTLDPALTYRVDVRARNHRGRSPWSNAVTVRPLDLVPTVRIDSPTAGAQLPASTDVEVTVVPDLPGGSVSELVWLQVCLAHPGTDGFLSCDWAYGWTGEFEPGQPRTFTLSTPWVDAATPYEVYVEALDAHERTGTARVPVTVVP